MPLHSTECHFTERRGAIILLGITLYIFIFSVEKQQIGTAASSLKFWLKSFTTNYANGLSAIFNFQLSSFHFFPLFQKQSIYWRITFQCYSQIQDLKVIQLNNEVLKNG